MTLRVAIGGFGAIGKVVARRLDQGVEGLTLTAVAARDVARAEAAMASFARRVAVVPLGRLWEEADVVVECAPAAVLRQLAEPALGHGRIVMSLSCGALLDNLDLVELARRNGGRILVPTGALLGLDAVIAAAEGGISNVTMITRKPPGGLAGAPYLNANNIDIAGLTGPKQVFSGTAREAARGFPANVNVAAALALAGIGSDRTMVEIWADPGHHAQYSPHRSRSRRRAPLDADRERSLRRQSAHWPADRAIGYCRIEEVVEPARHRHLTSRSGGVAQREAGPDVAERRHQHLYIRVAVRWAWGQAQALGAARHSGVVDRLDVNPMALQQLVARRLAQHRVADQHRHDVARARHDRQASLGEAAASIVPRVPGGDRVRFGWLEMADRGEGAGGERGRQ